MKLSILPAEHDNISADRVVGILEASKIIRTAGRLIQICAWCGRIENHRGFRIQPEDCLTTSRDVKFTHGICPEYCERMESLYKRQPAEEEKLRFEIQ